MRKAIFGKKSLKIAKILLFFGTVFVSSLFYFETAKAAEPAIDLKATIPSAYQTITGNPASPQSTELTSGVPIIDTNGAVFPSDGSLDIVFFGTDMLLELPWNTSNSYNQYDGIISCVQNGPFDGIGPSTSPFYGRDIWAGWPTARQPIPVAIPWESYISINLENQRSAEYTFTMTCLDTNSNTVQDSVTINFTQYHPVDIYTTYQVNGASQLGPTNVNYTITGPNGINLTGTQTGASTGYFHWLPAGIYTITYQSGGLAGTTFSGLQAFGFGVSNVATGANSITFTISDFNPSTGKYNRNNASVIMNFVTTSNPPAAQCSDGIDNDNDGKIDYPLDLGCSSASDNDENSKPVITLLGISPATTTQGSVYTDAGATAFDEEDGNITSSIVVSGDVISTTTLAGTYSIIYNVVDSKGSQATTTTRTVIVNLASGGGNGGGGGPGGNGTTTPNLVGTINVNAKLDGSPWLGAVNYNLVATSTANATSSPQTFLNQPIGTYILNYISGGPTGAIFSSTTPLSAQTLQASSTIVFTLNFLTQATTTPPLPQCSDGIDNDNDGKIDFPTDDDCANLQDNDENDEDDDENQNKNQCEDDTDNDNDGKIDEADPACHTDGNVGNNASYNQNLNDENSRPTITLLGNATATTTEGDVYTDAGATAFDEEDGNITANIVVSGNTISTTTPAGTYVIIFSVVDSKGATASTTRAVIVNPKVSGGGGNNNGGGNTGNGENNNGGGNSGNGNTGGNTGGNNSGGGGAVGVAVANGPIGFSGMPFSFAGASKTAAGAVLGVKTERKLEILPDKCNYLLEYLKFGQKNNPFEVKKLQYFLRNFEGFKTVASTGVFDLKTLSAVHDFQARYNDDVLRPWALPYSTGYVYITTKKKVNEIYCEREFLLTTEQKREIAKFNALMQRLKAGQSVSGKIVKKEIEDADGNIDKIEGESSDVFAIRNKESENNSETVLESATSSLAALISDTLPRDLYVENSGKVSGEKGFQDMLFYFFRYKLFIVSVLLFGVLILLVYRILKDAYKNKIQ